MLDWSSSMQTASLEYKKTIRQLPRNRGYIRATIGIINQEAQNSASAKESKLAYFSNDTKPFEGNSVSRIYATAEKNFSKIDGTMYFLPEENSSLNLYNNGLVSEDIAGVLYINFKEPAGFDIKGLMIEFGDSYPNMIEIEWDNGKNLYKNENGRFITEDVYEGVTFLKIIPVNMETRLRIFEITFGIAKTFTNESVLNYSLKEYVSPVSESIPSQDMVLEVDNQSLYYSVDNPESAFAFLETGQEIRVMFGYDITGNGTVEWLPENTCYLKEWKADDIKARFVATDRFDYITGYYYKGLYRENGISLYDLAIDVLNDAGIDDSKEYYLDPYLKNIIVYNPIPPVKSTEALQIIANAGRCILYQDRKKRIHMDSSFVPDMVISTDNKEEYSSVEKLLKSTLKEAYAIQSNDFSIVDGSVLFMPLEGPYKKTGYVSKSIADESGLFLNNPIITITSEASFSVYGLIINFRNVAPKQFVITTYNQGEQVEQHVIDDSELSYVTYETFELFDTMKIEFTKGYPNAKVTIDNILISDITDYTLERSIDIYGNPVGQRKNKVKSISVARNVYKNNSEIVELALEKVTMIESELIQTVVFSEPVYEISVSADSANVNAEIIEKSSYMVVVKLKKSTSAKEEFTYKVSGKKYTIDIFQEKSIYNAHGEEMLWNNPLISNIEHAKDVKDWIATHFLGDVEYEISWRGDPRIDAGDLIYLELKNRDTALTKIYQNTLNFNGAWSSVLKARKAVVSWQ